VHRPTPDYATAQERSLHPGYERIGSRYPEP